MYESFGAYLGESTEKVQQRIDAWDVVEKRRRRASVKRDPKQLTKLLKGCRGEDVEALFLESGYFMTLKHRVACLSALGTAARDLQAEGQRWPLDGLADQSTVAVLCREAARGLADESLPLSRLVELAEAGAYLRTAGFSRMLPSVPWAEARDEGDEDDEDGEGDDGLYLPDDADAVTVLLETVGGALASDIAWSEEEGDLVKASPAMHRKVSRCLDAYASAKHSHAGLVRACTAFYLRHLRAGAPLAKGVDGMGLSVACRSLASIGFSINAEDHLDTHSRDVRSAILVLAGHSERTRIRDAWALSIALATCALERGGAAAEDGTREAIGSALTSLLAHIDGDITNHATQARELSAYALCELHQAIVAHELLGVGDAPVSEHVRSAAYNAFTAAGTSDTRRTSALQEDARTVLADLQRPAMGSEVLDPLTGYVIDLTCGDATTPSSGRRALAIEVNGPTHYALSTGEPLGHTLLKDALLRAAFHPQGTAVVSLDYADWGALVGPKDRRDFLEDLIADAEGLCFAHQDGFER